MAQNNKVNNAAKHKIRGFGRE